MPKSADSPVLSDRKTVPLKQISYEKAIANAFFLSLGEGALVTDAEGKVSRINQAALEILGFALDDIKGKWFPDTVIAENEAGERLSYFERPIAQVFMTGKPVFSKTYYRRKDGSRVPVALTVSPVLLNSKPIGAIEVFRDITEEVALEKAKDEFISLASHQLRTPATGVKQYIGLLLAGYAGELTPKQKRFLKTADESNNRQLKIIDELLRVAASDAENITLQIEKVNVAKLMQSIIDEQASKFSDRQQTVEFTCNSKTPCIYVDRHLVRMALENILDNARKYTFPGKKIHVIVKEQRGKTQVIIKDEGTGIDKKDFDKLFQKFSRIDNPLSVSMGGTGLGLYWVKRIVELHQGSIEVSSQIGKGSTFTVCFEKHDQLQRDIFE